MVKTLPFFALFGMMACSGAKDSSDGAHGPAPKAASAAPSPAKEAVSGAPSPASRRRLLVEAPDSRIALVRQESTAVFTHAIPHRHADPCDFSGEKPELDSLVDFRVELEALPDPLPAAVRKREAGTALAERFVGADSVATEPGFLEAIRVGERTGFRILMGAEGCGEIVTYLPSGSGTLRMARRKVAEFDPAAGPDAKSRASLPGILQPREADELAEKILATARIEEP